MILFRSGRDLLNRGINPLLRITNRNARNIAKTNGGGKGGRHGLEGTDLSGVLCIAVMFETSCDEAERIAESPRGRKARMNCQA